MSKVCVAATIALLSGGLAAGTLALQSDGSVRLPDTLYSVRPRLSIDGKDCIAIGEAVPTATDGVAFEFRSPGKGLLARGTANLRGRSADGSAVADAVATWRIVLEKDFNKVEYGAIAELPQDEFCRGDFGASGASVRIRDCSLSLVGGGKVRAGDASKYWPHAPFWTLSFDAGGFRGAKKGDSFEYSVKFAKDSSRGDGLFLAFAGPVTVPDCGGWVQMDHRKTIVPGSALDFSQFVPRETPAGKYGWLRSVGGLAEFEKLPGVSQRFHGVNLCGTSCYPETPEDAEMLAERLMRLGYNSVRIHHYDGAFARYRDGKLEIDNAAADKLDRLVAALIARGIYLTTDLFVSRRVAWRDLGIDRDGNVPGWKAFQYATERGFDDWRDFSRLFLTHRNAYTGRTYAEEPALNFLCIQNETVLCDNFKGLLDIPELEIRGKWVQFLDETRAENPGAYPGFEADTPPQYGQFWDENPNDAVLGAFWIWLETRFFRRAEEYLRKDLGVKAILTGDNFGPTPESLLAMRESLYGYTDCHTYPIGWRSWVDRGYSMPLVAKTQNPLVEGLGLPEDGMGYSRLWNKPYCVSEWDYVGVNGYRSIAGLVFGSMAGLQGWTGHWRFAYEHSNRGFGDNFGEPSLYNLGRDPLALATDRATCALFLRRDIPEAELALALDATEKVLADPLKGRAWRSGPRWPKSDVAWNLRVGTVIKGQGAPEGARIVARDEYQRMGKEKALAIAGGAPCPVAIDRERGTFRIATPRTCGGFAREGVLECGALHFSLVGNVKMQSTPATVFAVSIDGEPLKTSRRILVTHLTDCRARGFATTDELGSIILRWNGKHDLDGTIPLYLKEGAAEIAIEVGGRDIGSDRFKVYALGTDGKREGEIPCSVAGNAEKGTSLRFTARTCQAFGGCMMYEIVRTCVAQCADAVEGCAATSGATLFFAGDSTLDEHADKPELQTKYGSWGSALRPFLRVGFSIANYGRSGRSTTSFFREGWWGEIVERLKPGDFVVIQFGHNDQKLDKPDVATPIPEYRKNLRRMASEVRLRGGIPVFATPIVRLTYGKDGLLVDTPRLDDWAETMQETAKELDVDLVDMRSMTREAANAAGETEALTWNAPGDRTHPGPKGAEKYSVLFLNDVSKRKLPVAGMFCR